MKLDDILPDDARCDRRFGAREIAGISADSRAIKPGFLFVAVPGTKADGASFVPQALAAGAVAVMAERALALPEGVAADRSRQHSPRAGAGRRKILFRASRRPSPRSPAPAARRRWPRSRGKSGPRKDYAAASIGTVGVVSPNGEIYGSLTTPDPVELASHRSIGSLAMASPILRSKHPRTASISIGSMACGSRPAVSPTCRAIISTITTPRSLSRRQAHSVRAADHAARQRGDRGGRRIRRRGCCGGARARPDDIHRRVAPATGLSSPTSPSRGSRNGCELCMRVNPFQFGCRWSANFRSRTRWWQPVWRFAPAAMLHT